MTTFITKICIATDYTIKAKEKLPALNEVLCMKKIMFLIFTANFCDKNLFSYMNY